MERGVGDIGGMLEGGFRIPISKLLHGVEMDKIMWIHFDAIYMDLCNRAPVAVERRELREYGCICVGFRISRRQAAGSSGK